MLKITIENKTFIADILIVDDQPENIQFLSNFLSKHNYQVRKAINGKDALKSIKSSLPDLILLDINMPEIGGYEVCESLKNDPSTSSIPIIFLSASDEITDKIRAFKVGGIDYVTKPFQVEEVLARVKTQLKIRRLQKVLESRNNQLQNMITDLQNAQIEIVQKEKLVNTSKIVASISHEINNPLSFILCNLNPAFEYSEKLLALIKLYQQAFPDINPKIKKNIEEIELDLTTKDYTNAINSIRNGAVRIRSIIHALHIFYRLDKTGIKMFDIQENIDSVIMKLSNKFVIKNGLIRISIIKNYENIPIILSYENLFNQALINLLQNAIDALELKINSTIDDSFQPTIWIHTYTRRNNQIIISIKDNGVGINEEHKHSLFDPFFTTKLVNKSSGLGLFTTYQIIQEIHKGNLIYRDFSEGGSEFIIQIPV